ncbi:MAG: signal peptide peptidase SppA [Pseudomonadota bacterium]
MSENRSITKSIFVGLWNALNFSRRLVFNILFVLIVVGLIIVISSADDGKVKVSDSSALILNLSGDLVVQKQYVDPIDAFIQEATGQDSGPKEILVRDLVKAINNAKVDNRIGALILDLEGFNGGGLDKLKRVADAIQDFKSDGKPVYAIGDYYTRNQYLLAVQADNVYLHPMGGMILEGYSRYGNYFAEGLEKIKASTHVFKVGKFKSAVEPFTRNNMSPEAKEANIAWLNGLWGQYKEEIVANRNFDEANFDETFASAITKFEAVDGDFAQYALQNGWVDGLRTREEFRSEMKELLGPGEGDKPYNFVSFNGYLDLITPDFALPPPQGDKVAIVVAKGTILDGNQKAGTIGGDSTAKLLREARTDDEVKAVVLQVDSGGGSAFASEVIRREVELLKEEGKPVVASMGSVAASGGYWISASADHIVAEPSTITGSIGIFGMFTTFERSFNHLGIYSDGVATNELSGIAPDRPLEPGYAQLIQMNIEHGYDQFISLVAGERGMTKEAVNEIAQGRVWIGTQALDLGLVDELGNLSTAVNKAAELAQLEQFEEFYVVPKLSEKEQLLQEIFKTAATFVNDNGLSIKPSPLIEFANKMEKQIELITSLNDPRATYALCDVCNIQ